MLFNVERDLGDAIVFYVVPDAFSAVPSARLIAGGRVLLEIEANESRQALVAAGRHETGRCAFAVDGALVPDLALHDDLSIVDVDTEVLIYRRPRPDFAQRKIMNLTGSLFPPRVFNAVMQEHFQYSALQMERHGHETVNQLFLLHEIHSIYLSGRINYRNYEHYIENGFDVFLYLDEPYMALAERLIILSKLEKIPNPAMLVGERDAMLFQPAMEFARNLDMTDGKALRRAFRAMPEEAAVALVDPQVRLLTATNPTDMARDNALPKALDVLAASSAVGISKHADLFADTVAAYLGIEPSLVSAPPRFGGVGELAALLKEQARVEHLIDKDLALYAITESAFSKAS